MYRIKLEAIDTATTEEIQHAQSSIKQVIREEIDNGSSVKSNGSDIVFETTIDDKQIKSILKPTFSHYIEVIRFISISS